MIEELKTHWPLIVQYPWEFLWAFGLGMATGWGVPAVWRWLFPLPSGTVAEPGLLKKLWAKITSFRPSALQIECIKVLREFDTLYLSPVQVAHAINQAKDDPVPVSDVDQAIEELEVNGWARWELRPIPGGRSPGSMGQAYQLCGPGLNYARKKKFVVGSWRNTE